jgi:hypothetical protein
MFQLETKVRHWCKHAIPVYWLRPSSLAEMEDHLLCVIEQLTKDGTSAEQAFVIATERLGEAKLLRDEFRKNARYSLNRSLKYTSELAAIGGATLVFAASVGGIDVTAWAHHFLVALYSFPSSFLSHFS